MIPCSHWKSFCCSSLCFAALPVNNAVLFVDLILLPNLDLLTVRTLNALVGLAAGIAVFQLLKRVDNYQVEVLLTFALAMAA